MVREIRRRAKTRSCMELRKLMCWKLAYPENVQKSSVAGLRKSGRQAEAKARKMYAVLSEFGENWQVGEKIGEKRTRTARNAHPSGVGKTDEVICNESEHRL